MIIRKACEQDAKRMAQINVTCWHITYKGLFSEALLNDMQVTDKRIATFKRYIQEREVFLAEEKGVVQGYLMGGLGSNKDIPIPYEIYGLYVDPDFQGKGAGTALIQAFEKEIEGQGYYLYAAAENKKAISFYEKMGLVLTPEYNCVHTFRDEKMPCVCLLSQY